MRGNSHVRFGGRPRGKGPAQQEPRRAAHPSQTGKGHFGLDHSQVRLYPALRRHIVLVMVALAMCAVTASAMRAKTSTLPPEPATPDDMPPQEPGLIALTVAEIKRLLNLVSRTWRIATHHLHWTWWRRRHQARARWHHQRTRLRRQAKMSWST